MNKPPVDEVTLFVQRHTDVVKSAGTVYANISSTWHTDGRVDFTSGVKCNCPLDWTDSIILETNFSYIYSKHTDGRRKRRFYYDHYDNTEEMVAYMMDYYRISLNKYHTPYKQIKNLVKKWGKTKMFDKVYEHEEGKIIATF